METQETLGRHGTSKKVLRHGLSGSKVESTSRGHREKERKKSECRNCAKLYALILAPVSLVCGLLAITVLMTYFLVVDDGKGGACAQTSGRAIWIYSIFRLVVSSFSAQVCRTEVNEQETQNACPQFLTTCCGYSIALTVWIYGGIVIYGADVCDQFKNTGLYKLASAVYIIDVILGSLGMMYQFYQLLVPPDLRPAWMGTDPSKKRSNHQKDVVERPLDMEKADGDKDEENRQKELGTLKAEVERRKAAKAEADRKREVMARIEAEIDAEERGVADVVPPPNKI